MSDDYSEVGQVAAVEVEEAGGNAVGDHPAGTTTIQLNDASDFPEIEAQARLGDIVIDVSAVDADTDVITLAAPSPAAVEDGERIFVHPSAPTTWAHVIVDPEEPALQVEVPFGIKAFTGLEPGDLVRFTESSQTGALRLVEVIGADPTLHASRVDDAEQLLLADQQTLGEKLTKAAADLEAARTRLTAAEQRLNDAFSEIDLLPDDAYVQAAKQQAIDAAAVTAQQKADAAKATAIADAQGKLTTARSQLETAIATGDSATIAAAEQKVLTARAEAIAAAAQDATAKAAQAKADAIAAAALDATSKATEALTRANEALTAADAAQATADNAIRTYYSATPPWPDGSAQPDDVLGDMWYDDDSGQAYRWNGSSWIVIVDQTIGQALAAAQNAQTTADGKISGFYQPTEPLAADEGDLWYDTDDNNKPYARKNGQWVSIADLRVAAQATTLANIQQDITGLEGTLDGKSNIWVQTAAPTGLTATNKGDIWINDGASPRTTKVWNGTGWVDADSRITQAVADVAKKITTYYTATTTAPTGTFVEGDLWIDVNGKIARRQTNSWVTVSDPKARADAARDAAISAAASDATAKANAARDAATTAAAADASSKAAAAEAAAKSAAATDAQSKADKAKADAEAAAKAYADTVASGAGGEALDAAKTYAEQQAEAARVAAQNAAAADASSKAAAAEAAAKSAAAADATAKANQAETNAKNAAAAALAPVATRLTTAEGLIDGKANIFYQPSAPTGLTLSDAGDIWIDSDANPKTYKSWSGTAWVDVTDATTVDVLGKVSTKVSTYVTASTTAPSAPSGGFTAGDLWVDSNGKIARWSGSAWVTATDPKALADKAKDDAVANAQAARAANHGYLYKRDVIVYGDSDKFYPVTIMAGDQNLKRDILIKRNYSEQAPPDWNTATHKGGLTVLVKANFGGWGGANYSWEIHELEEMYSNTFGGALNVFSNMGFAVMLRGGGTTGAIYHMFSDQPLDSKGSGALPVGQVYYNSDLVRYYDDPEHERYDHPSYKWNMPAPRATPLAANWVEEIRRRKFIKLAQDTDVAVQQQAATLVAVQSDIVRVEGKADGKANIYVQTTAPTGMSAADQGDIWIDSSGGQRVTKVWSGTAWQEADTRTAQALAEVDTKIVTYFQPASPTGTDFTVGDLWVNSTGKIARWSGTAWVTVSDPKALADTAEANAKAFATSRTDGLAKTLWSTALPGTTTAPQDSVWYQHSGGKIVAVFTQTGAGTAAQWVARPITSEAIDNLDAGKITSASGQINDLVANLFAAKLADLIEANIGNLTVTGDAHLNEVVAERIWGDVASFARITADQVLAGNIEAVWSIATGGKIIAGDPDGARVEMGPDGIRVFALGFNGQPYEAVSMVAGQTSFAVVDQTRGVIAGISSAGDVTGQAASFAKGVTVRGTDLTGQLGGGSAPGLLDVLPRGIVPGGLRSVTTAGTAASGEIISTTLRVTLEPGRLYRVVAKFTGRVSTSTGVIRLRLRRTLDTGARPTTSSPIFGDEPLLVGYNSSVSVSGSCEAIFTRSTRTDMVVSLTYQGLNGSTAQREWTQIYVEDLGLRSVDFGGGDDDTPKTTYTTAWAATASRGYTKTGATIPAKENKLDLWYFGSSVAESAGILFGGQAVTYDNPSEAGRTIPQAFNGATLHSVELELTNAMWWNKSTRNLGVNTLGGSALPSEKVVEGSAFKGDIPEGGTVRIPLDPAWFLNGGNIGVTVGDKDGSMSVSGTTWQMGAGQFHGPGDPSPPRLIATYSR